MMNINTFFATCMKRSWTLGVYIGVHVCICGHLQPRRFHCDKQIRQHAKNVLVIFCYNIHRQWTWWWRRSGSVVQVLWLPPTSKSMPRWIGHSKSPVDVNSVSRVVGCYLDMKRNQHDTGYRCGRAASSAALSLRVGPVLEGVPFSNFLSEAQKWLKFQLKLLYKWTAWNMVLPSATSWWTQRMRFSSRSEQVPGFIQRTCAGSGVQPQSAGVSAEKLCGPPVSCY